MSSDPVGSVMFFCVFVAASVGATFLIYLLFPSTAANPFIGAAIGFGVAEIFKKLGGED